MDVYTRGTDQEEPCFSCIFFLERSWCSSLQGCRGSFPPLQHQPSHQSPVTLLTIHKILWAHWGVYWDPRRLGSTLPCPYLVMLWSIFTLAHFGLNWSTCCLSPLPVLPTIGFSALSAFHWCLYHPIWLSFGWDMATFMFPMLFLGFGLCPFTFYSHQVSSDSFCAHLSARYAWFDCLDLCYLLLLGPLTLY